MIIFAPKMEKILKVHNVNDYARYIGAQELHPLVSVTTSWSTAGTRSTTIRCMASSFCKKAPIRSLTDRGNIVSVRVRCYALHQDRRVVRPIMAKPSTSRVGCCCSRQSCSTALIWLGVWMTTISFPITKTSRCTPHPMSSELLKSVSK